MSRGASQPLSLRSEDCNLWGLCYQIALSKKIYFPSSWTFHRTDRRLVVLEAAQQSLCRVKMFPTRFSLLWSYMIFPLCSGRVTRGQTGRGETDRPTSGGRRRVDRDRRLNDAGAGGVVERTEKLLAARERERAAGSEGGPSASQNFNSALSVRSFRRREPPPSSVRKVRFVRIRLPSSLLSSSQVDDKNAGRTARTDRGATLSLSLSAS